MKRDPASGRAKLIAILVVLTALDLSLHLATDPRGLVALGMELIFAGYVWWRGSTSGLSIMACVLIGMGALTGLAAFVGHYSSAHASVMLFFAAAWALAGFILLSSLDIRAYLEDRASLDPSSRYRQSVVASNDERWGDSLGVQVVGHRCDVCAKLVAVEREAEVCEACRTPFHCACIAVHREKIHAKEIAANR